MNRNTQFPDTDISVVIPVLHEEKSINAIVAHVLHLEAPGDVEIVVVDGSSDGNTIKALTHKGIKTLISRAGRARQMNAGAQVATKDAVIFLHADTRLPHDGLLAVAHALQDGYRAGAFALGFDDDSFGMRLIAGTANLRSAFTRVPYGDQAQFFLRQYFGEIGGYSEMPLMEDIELMRRIKQRGDAILLLKTPVVTSARRWRTEGAVFCTLRNWCIRILYHLGMPSQKLASMYRFGRRRAE